MGTHIDAQARGGVLGKFLFAIDARNAVGGREVLELLRPAGVEELVSFALRLKLNLVLKLLTRNVFVHEALAAQVQPQVAVVANNATAVGASAATHVVNDGSVPLLDVGTSPCAHLVALTDVGVVARGVHVEGQNLNAVLNALRSVELHHVLVAQVVAGRDNNGLRVDLDVLLRAGLLSENASHGAVGVLNKFDALGLVTHIGARVDGALQVVLHDGRQAAEADRCGVAGQIFLGVIIGLGHGIHVREHVVLLACLGNLGIAFRSDVKILGTSHKPVEGLARLVVVGRNDGLVHMMAALFHVHIDDHLLVKEAVAAAPLGLRLATENSHVGSNGVELRRRLERNNLRTSLGGSASGRNASGAQAYNDNVGVDGLFNVGIGNFGLLAKPRHSARAVEAHRGLTRSGSLGVGFGVALGAGSSRRASAQASHAGNRGTRDSSAGQEVTTAHTILNAHGVILPLDCAAPSGCALTMWPSWALLMVRGASCTPNRCIALWEVLPKKEPSPMVESRGMVSVSRYGPNVLNLLFAQLKRLNT